MNIIFGIIFIFVVGCSNTSLTENFIFLTDSISNKKIEEPREYEFRSNILKAVFSGPVIRKRVQSIYLSKLEVSSIDTDKKTKLFATGSAGLLDEYETESREVAFGSLRADRLIDDNKKLENSVKIGQINTKIEIHNLNLEVDNYLQEIHKAFNELNLSLRTMGILNKYLKMYEDKERLIERAVFIGAISNSEFLELKSLKNEALSKLSKAELLRKKSDNILKSNLNDFYNKSVAELKSLAPKQRFELVKPNKNIRVEIIRLQKRKLNIEIDIQEKSLRPINKLSASATSPQSKSKNLTLFAGLTLDFPIRDGGKSQANINRLEKKKVILDLEEEDLKKSGILIEKQWINFSAFFKNQKNLFDERLKISKKRLKELEILQKQGRVNSGTYLKEVLTLANAEVEIANLEANYNEEILKTMSLSSNTCKLLNLCREIEKYLKDI